MELEFRVLGPVEVVHGGTTLPLGGGRPTLVLAILLANAGETISAARLVEGVWGEDPPEQASHALQVHISGLRKVLEPDRPRGAPPSTIVTDGGGYRIAVEARHLDHRRFERLLAASRRALAADDPAEADRGATEGLSLWRGDAFGELGGEHALLPEAVRLDEIRLEAAETRLAAQLKMGRHAELVGELEELVDGHPLRERLWGQLMVALYRSGRQADALRAYRRVEQLLGEELGISPSTELRDLETQILLQDEQLAIARKPFRAPSNVPSPLTGFIGREHELAEVHRLLDGHRLVTILGSGGMGKTRLAMEAAARERERWSGGVWWVGLGPLRDERLVAAAVAEALGIDQQPGIPVTETVIETLRHQRALIVLDNCEHLLEEAARFGDSVVTGCPDAGILATSREPLGLVGEQLLLIEGLGAAPSDPGEEDDLAAVRLFQARAEEIGGKSFAEPEAVAELCSRLDGVPLAIELAAARTSVLTVEQIVARLDDRFRLLVDGGRSRDARQETLAATMDWSHGLLDEHEQRLFRRLAVFPSEFSLEAAEAICADEALGAEGVLDSLAALVRKSLLQVLRRGTAEARYSMLETVRHYAQQKLDVESSEKAALFERYRHFYARLAARAGPATRGPEQLRWMEVLEREHDNMRSMLDASVAAGDLTTQVRVTGFLAWFWFLHSHLHEGWERLEAALEQSELIEPEQRIRLLLFGAQFAWEQAANDRARQWLGEALAAAEGIGSKSRAWVIAYFALLDFLDEQYEKAGERAVDAQALFEASGDGAGFLFSSYIGHAARYSIVKDAGELTEADTKAARELLDNLIVAAEATRERNILGHLLWTRAIVAHDEGDYVKAFGLLDDSLVAFRDLGNKSCAGHVVDQVALTAIQVGKTEEAARLLAASHALRERLGSPGHTYEQSLRSRAQEEADALLSASEATQCRAEGVGMTFEETIEAALEVVRS